MNRSDLPKNWALTFVGHVCDNIKYGFTASATDEPIGPRFLRITDIQNGEVDWPKVPHCKIDARKVENYLLRVGDIVFARTGGTVGKSFIMNSVPERSVFASYLIRLSPGNGILSKYLYHYFQSASYWEEIGLKKGGLQGNVNATTLSRLSLPLCPTNEQKLIVAKIEELLSELDKGVESLKTAQKQLKVYRQAVLKHAFEGRLTTQWREENKNKLETADQLLARIKREREARYQQQLAEWKAAVSGWEASGQAERKPGKPTRLKELRPIEADELAILPRLPDGWDYVRLAEVAEIGSGMSVSKSRALAEPIQVPYLRVANVQRGCLMLDEITTMNIERSQLPRLELKHWDVLFNEGGDRDKLGRGWVWESHIKPCITQNHVFRASAYVPSEAHAKFISYWGNTFGQAYFERKGKQTTNLASINKTVLSDFPVPLPSFEEQAKILSELEAQVTIADRFELEIATALDRLETLRQSILKKAFCGQLVAQDASDEPASVLLERIRAEKGAQSKVIENCKRRNAA